MFSRDSLLRTRSKQNTFIYQGPSGEEAPASTAGILREGQGASKKERHRKKGPILRFFARSGSFLASGPVVIFRPRAGAFFASVSRGESVAPPEHHRQVYHSRCGQDPPARAPRSDRGVMRICSVHVEIRGQPAERGSSIKVKRRLLCLYD